MQNSFTYTDKKILPIKAKNKKQLIYFKIYVLKPINMIKILKPRIRRKLYGGKGTKMVDRALTIYTVKLNNLFVKLLIREKIILWRNFFSLRKSKDKRLK